MVANWLVNPFQNPLTGPIALMLALLFGGAGLALLVTTNLKSWILNWSTNTGITPEFKIQNSPIGQPYGPKFKTVLWQRYRTWAIIAPLFAGAALSGPLTLAGLCAFLIWQGGREYAALTKLPALHRGILIFGGWLTLAGVLVFGGNALMYAPVIAFFVWAALSLSPVAAETEVAQRFGPMLSGLWGYLYLGWLPAHLVALSNLRFTIYDLRLGNSVQSSIVNPQSSIGLVLAVALGVAMSDVGAFCTGKLLGGPKLAPRLSPNKTWGGVLGNVIGAALALALIAFALPTLQWWQFAALALTIAIGSVWGDLLESLLKRQHGVKDAGALLPGFGGLLDRIDSLLLVAPLVYYLSILILNS